MRARERQGGETKSEPRSLWRCPAVSGPPLAIRGREATGAKGERSAEHTARGSVGEPRRRPQGPPKPPGRWLGPGVVRKCFEASLRPSTGFVSEAAAAAGGRRSRGRPAGRPLLRRPRVSGLGRGPLVASGEQATGVCVWGGLGLGKLTPVVRKPGGGERPLVDSGPRPSSPNLLPGPGSPQSTERETNREVRPRYGPLTPRGHSDSNVWTDRY